MYMLIVWSDLVCFEQPEGQPQSLGVAPRIVCNILCVQSHTCHKHTNLDHRTVTRRWFEQLCLTDAEAKKGTFPLRSWYLLKGRNCHQVRHLTAPRPKSRVQVLSTRLAVIASAAGLARVNFHSPDNRHVATPAC